MSLKNTNQKGFTIVELLIVIVVIAILAAISIVAFTGVQQRGRDSARASDVNSIAKALTAYTADGAAWPVTGRTATPNTGASGVLATYTTANVGSTVLGKIQNAPANSDALKDTYGYAVCPAGATAGNGTGAQLTWWKEQSPAGMQTTTVGTGC